MARPKTEMSVNHVRSIVAKYTNQGIGMIELGKLFHCSITVIRRILVEQKVKINGRGRPQLVG